MEREQLPRALELRPTLAAVVVGVNDTLRRDFAAGRVGAALAHSVGALSAAGATVLTMRLPDPGRMFGLPGALARPLSRRIRAVNAVADAVAARYGSVHFDAAGHPQTYDRRMWSIDRLHPSERGHRLVAHSYAGCRTWWRWRRRSGGMGCAAQGTASTRPRLGRPPPRCAR